MRAGALGAIALGNAELLWAQAPGAAPPKPTAESIGAIPFEFESSTVADLTAAMAAGKLTSRALCETYLNRIQAMDGDLHSVLETNPEALDIATRLDGERKAGKLRGPLHGIPVLVKDNIATGDRMLTTAGSLALAGAPAPRDAFIVERLRNAGAVILGKTNLSEWANFRSTQSSSGWSGRGGQCRNPYVLDRSPCGSSSGTGTAIAASLAAIGVGTETDGSIICPSAVAGLVGLKPTVGLVSRRGIIPISISQDTAGPMARSVSDVALFMNALAGVDDQDPAGPAAQGHIPADYTAFLKAGALKGQRFGVLRQAMGFHPASDEGVARAIDTIKAAGAEVVDVKFGAYNAWDDPELEVMLYEFKDGLNQYLKASGSPHASLEALIAFNKSHATTVMPFFGQELFERAQAKGPLTDAAYKKVRDDARRLAGKEGLLAALDRDRLDGIIAPSVSPAWPTDHVLGDRFLGAGYGVAAVAGTPSITVPIAEAQGLPVGFTIMGRAYSEPDLIAFAYAIEQATKARKPPQFQPTIP